MTRRFEDNSLQSLMDAAIKVMEAAYEDETSANRAIAQMRAVANNLEYRSQEITKQLSGSIDTVANRTAAMAAEKLAKKFTQADEQAEQAAQRYASAARLLTWKLVATAVAAQVVVVGAVYGILVWRLPSIEDARNIEQQVSIAQAAVNQLSAKGGRSSLIACDDNGRKRLCIRTNEQQSQPYRFPNSSATYRIIYGY